MFIKETTDVEGILVYGKKIDFYGIQGIFMQINQAKVVHLPPVKHAA